MQRGTRRIHGPDKIFEGPESRIMLPSCHVGRLGTLRVEREGLQQVGAATICHGSCCALQLLIPDFAWVRIVHTVEAFPFRFATMFPKGVSVIVDVNGS